MRGACSNSITACNLAGGCTGEAQLRQLLRYHMYKCRQQTQINVVWVQVCMLQGLKQVLQYSKVAPILHAAAADCPQLPDTCMSQLEPITSCSLPFCMLWHHHQPGTGGLPWRPRRSQTGTIQCAHSIASKSSPRAGPAASGTRLFQSLELSGLCSRPQEGTDHGKHHAARHHRAISSQARRSLPHWHCGAPTG